MFAVLEGIGIAIMSVFAIAMVAVLVNAFRMGVLPLEIVWGLGIFGGVTLMVSIVYRFVPA
ncbi:MAG: hypothetical protein QOF51_3927, partial [Chloroflexota bacterium]|nr:hypothetical protein [Chloroflexota bacterium]